MDSLKLTDKQQKILLDYLDERRGKYNAAVVTAVILTALSSLPAFAAIWMLANKKEGEQIHDVFIAALCVFAALLLALGALIVHGWQVFYGRKCPYNCILRHEFSVYPVTVRGIEVDQGHHPFVILATDRYSYTCPVYLDYKHSQNGQQMLGICTDYGARFAMAMQ